MTMAYIPCGKPKCAFCSWYGPYCCLISYMYRFLYRNFMHGTYCEPSIRTFRWYGIKCLSCLYRCWCGWVITGRLLLLAVFVEGIIFIVLSLTNVREAIFDAIPLNLKKGVSVGIGIFIAFIGLQNAKLVIGNKSTLVSITNFTKDFHTAGICSLLAVIGLLITVILYIKKYLDLS